MPHAHPSEVVRVMWPQILRTRLTAAHHFRNRHVNGNAPARNWCAEVRRIDRASGYSDAVRQARAPQPCYRQTVRA